MEYFSTSKLQDEIKTEKFELNKFHASKKTSFEIFQTNQLH
jgi:hypothetical protein